MNISGNLASEERLSWIRSRLADTGAVKIAVAATELNVSEMTIRRDLRELEAEGLARRVRGGAVAVGPVPFADRHRHHAKAKSRIASKLLQLLPASGAVGFDASSTMLRLASVIDGGRDLTILSNGLQTFQSLQGKPGLRPVLMGGEHDPRTGSLVGPVATRSASILLVHRFFMSAAAVDPDVGASEATIEDAEVKQVLAGVAGEVVLAVDSSKLGSRAVALSLGWERAAFLVTELEPGDMRLEPYRGFAEIL